MAILASFFWVFKVGRGACTFARTPENYGLNVDFGRDSDSRPLKCVEELILPNLARRMLRQ